ncbi:MAG TPA: RluA family pseudouridine synthase [Rhodanobacteraceae bacterium]|nr:RluA family pseudouridine synthase [Rhodanobacteraceae bacterium]
MKTRTSSNYRDSASHSARRGKPANGKAGEKSRRTARDLGPAPAGIARGGGAGRSAARGGRTRDCVAPSGGGKRAAPMPKSERRSTAESRETGPPPGARHVEVATDHAGQRIDNFLATRLKGVPKNLIYRLLRTGQVRINSRRARPDQRLAEGDDVRIPPLRTAERPAGVPPAPTRLVDIQATVIHEDREFLVIDKPSGIASHGGSGITFGVIELLRAARPRDTLELAHRLDRDTSGVLVLSRKRSALIALQAEIRAGRVAKRYLALLAGELRQSGLQIDAPLRKSVLRGGERMVRVDPEGKPSRSRITVVKRYANATLVEIALETGRTHQIRVHCAHLDHPVAGDEKYGDPAFNRDARARGLKRLFLHAARFEFGIGDRDYCFSAPLPAELSAVLDTLES